MVLQRTFFIRIIVFGVLLLSKQLLVLAQNDGAIVGKVRRPNGSAVMFCNVALLSQSTGSVAGGSVTDRLGAFKIEMIPELLSITSPLYRLPSK